jgi:hypothetical protein
VTCRRTAEHISSIDRRHGITILYTLSLWVAHKSTLAQRSFLIYCTYPSNF